EDDLEPAAAFAAQGLQEQAEDLALRDLVGDAEQLGADLIELALPSRPLLLVANHVAAIEETERQLERGEARRQEAGEHGGEIRAQGELLAVAVDEAVELAAARRGEERLVGL